MSLEYVTLDSGDLRRKLMRAAREMELTGSEKSAMVAWGLIKVKYDLHDPEYAQFRVAFWALRNLSDEKDLLNDTLVELKVPPGMDRGDIDRQLVEKYADFTKLMGTFIRASLTRKSALGDLLDSHFKIIEYVASLEPSENEEI